MPRVRFKIFGAYHTAIIEKEVNEWLRKLEEKGFYPKIIRKESRVAVNDTGKAFALVTFFYTLAPLDDKDPLMEVNMDAL